MRDRDRRPPRVPSRVPPRSERSSRSRVPPRRPDGHRRRPTRSGPPWRWAALGIGGVVLLAVAAFFVVRAFGTKQATPLPTPVASATAPTTIPPSSTPSTSPTDVDTPLPATPVEPLAPDIPALQQLMLTLINEDRRANGLSELAWDSIASTAGLRHAQEMARFGYLSHWNLDGYGPDYRYSLAGGLGDVRENVYMYEYSPGGGPTSSEDWQALIGQAQQELMESSGHRENILAPEHTHVGIGIAYNAETGDVRIVQEFINRYVSLEPIPQRAKLGDTIVVSGELLRDASNPLINLAYEPFPTPVTIDWLDETSTYTSPAVPFEAMEPTVKAGGHFSVQATLDAEGQPGIYHIYIWIDVDGKSVKATNAIIEVTP